MPHKRKRPGIPCCVTKPVANDAATTPDFTRPLRWQVSEDIFQIVIRIMSIELGRLDQAHQRYRTFSTAQRVGKQPVLAYESLWSYLIFDVIVVYWHRAVVQIADQCRPAFEAVIQGFGNAQPLSATSPLGIMC